MADTGFFANNRLVKVCLGLDNFALSSESEKNILLRWVLGRHYSVLLITQQDTRRVC
jgi:hypothetical protein